MISRCLLLLSWTWFFALGAGLIVPQSIIAQAEPQWIWSPEHDPQQVPNDSCHFRKEFSCRYPESARIEITADDTYELYVNGREVPAGQGAGRVNTHDISRLMIRGRNVIAAQVSNTKGNTAGLAARVVIKERNAGETVLLSDHTWKTNLRPFPLWNTLFYNDGLWVASKENGPWENQPKVAQRNPKGAPVEDTSTNESAADPDEPTSKARDTVDARNASGPKTPRAETAVRAQANTGSKLPGVAIPDPRRADQQSADAKQADQPSGDLPPRFRVSSEFVVEEVINDEKTGSLLAMTFNEFGHIVASREDGKLILIHDSNKDGIVDRVREYGTEVKGCQGILALNGDVFVTGHGPDGNGLYRMIDKDRDGKLEAVETIMKFKGDVGEHGPHGLTLGPDGWIYVIVGNHSAPDAEYAESSPHKNWYEGDLLPRYEDPGGHAVGIKAPGGVVARVKPTGGDVECFAGGLRNAYDLAFNSLGDLFVHDSDMEADIGMNWYRPTQLYMIQAGGEYGWRSGWATWPEYFPDLAPPTLKTGRGSPTAAVVYDHFMFPKRYHGRLFLGDWSEGRILSVKMQREGAGYQAESDVFMEGHPLNITDMDVGPDGALYFVTGGRRTSGGIFRVRWKGEVPPAVQNLGEGISAAIRQPQIQSAWARQKVAIVKQELGSKWNSQIAGVARSAANPAPYRIRALDLMQLLGPAPSAELLLKLAADKDPEVRAKAADMMALHPSDETTAMLGELLGDSHPLVCRRAAEALLRLGAEVTFDKIQPLLKSEDRMLATSARRLLERQPIDEWREAVLSTDDHRVFIQGALALVIAHPEKENATNVLDRFRVLLEDFISDANFVDMIRVAEVAIQRGGIGPTDVPELGETLAEEFPANNPIINRELSRLLVYLQVASPMDRYLAYLKSSVPEAERLHLAMHLRFLESGWQEGQRLKVIEFLERAQKRKETGTAFPLYVNYAARDLGKAATPEETREILARGHQWPAAMLGALYTLPRELDADTRQQLMDMDDKITDNTEDAYLRLKVGIVAVLARQADDASYAYMRDVWEKDPERRTPIAIGLAQAPDGENWDYLVRSLSLLEGPVAREVLVRLRSVDRSPEDPEYVRQVILRALMLGENGAQDAFALLEHWTGESFGEEGDSWETIAEQWQEWFTEQYPDKPEPVLPTIAKESKWKMDDLMKHFSSADSHRASPARGIKVFAKAQCSKCHRFDGKGESLGPDLTSIRKRFQKKEIIESILYPSHVISDQYASKTVVTTKGRSHTGIVTKSPDGEIVVLESTGSKVTIKEKDVDEITPSKQSAMPVGLLDPLTLDEISDLFAYLGVLDTPQMARRATSTTK